MIIRKSDQIIQEVGKAIIGKDEIIRKVLMAMYANGHVLLEDSPGVGKTTLALAFSRALGFEYRRIQFTPDTMPADITGFSMFNKQTGNFEYRPGAVNCNLLLGDEINRTSAKTQAALLEVMEERGLIDLNRRTGRIQITLRRVEQKVDLEASEIIRRLRKILEDSM